VIFVGAQRAEAEFPLLVGVHAVNGRAVQLQLHEHRPGEVAPVHVNLTDDLALCPERSGGEEEKSYREKIRLETSATHGEDQKKKRGLLRTRNRPLNK
jgi:hypothetical protein